MSDSDAPKPPPKPTAKTSTVPLKKETVRITLRAKPGAGITQPKEETSRAPTVQGAAPKPPVAKPAAPKPPVAPAAGGPPKPPAKTVPLAATPAPAGDMNKTQKVTVRATPAPTKAPAKTVPLAKATPAASAPGAAPATKALPKATVKLQQPTQPMGTTELPAPQPTGALTSSAAADSMALEDEPEGGILPFAIIASVLGLAALIIAMMASDVVGLSVPENVNPTWEKKTDTGYKSTFSPPEVPVYEG